MIGYCVIKHGDAKTKKIHFNDLYHHYKDVSESGGTIMAYVINKYHRVVIKTTVFENGILDLYEGNTDIVYLIPADKAVVLKAQLWKTDDLSTKYKIISEMACTSFSREVVNEAQQRYYTFGYADQKGNIGKVTVKSVSKEAAEEKIYAYHVSHGEFHDAWLLSISETGEEKFYENKKSEQAMALLIAAFGAALGHTQISNYGNHGSLRNGIKQALTDKETQYMIRRGRQK